MIFSGDEIVWKLAVSLATFGNQWSGYTYTRCVEAVEFAIKQSKWNMLDLHTLSAKDLAKIADEASYALERAKVRVKNGQEWELL